MSFIAEPIEASPEQLAQVTYDADGLVAAIVQDAENGQVLMMAWMNAESLARTMATGRTWFWSRSRQELWCKGETSGDRQYVRAAFHDCDGDALLFIVDQEGRGACHTGERSCFFRAFGPAPGDAAGSSPVGSSPVGSSPAGTGPAGTTTSEEPGAPPE